MAAIRALRIRCLWVLSSCLIAVAPAWAGICRVTTAGLATNDGTSWTTGANGVGPVSLQQALKPISGCTELWVAKGVYKPTTTTDTSISFVVADATAVYGGFAGNETAREQRNPAANVTVLSGDIDNNDTTDANGVDTDATHIVGSNAKNVMRMVNVGGSTVLDGFTITGGDSRQDMAAGGGILCLGSPVLSGLVFSGNAAYRGGAIYNLNIDSSSNSSPVISRTVFRGNLATLDGGAMYNDAEGGISSPVLSHVTFSGNATGDNGRGGAIFNYAYNNGTSSPVMAGVTFVDNSATNGGAVFNFVAANGVSRPALNNVTFTNNRARDNGNGGAIYNYADAEFGLVAAELTNATFSGNRVTDGFGGAVFNSGGPSSGAVFRNVILWGDVSYLGQGPEIFLSGGATATFDHSILKGSGGSGAGWNPAFGTDGGGNLDVDPRLGALAYNLGSTQTMLPAVGSPAIDAGNDSGCPAEDQRGIVRPQGVHCDIGAVETFPVDLVGHKGFETCWSQALTKPAFLALVRATVEGSVTCIPPSSGTGYTACNTAACPGGAMGCPITTHAGPFGDSGNFTAGIFSAVGSASDVIVPISISGFGNCTITASGITTTYAPAYAFTDDGNFGDYMALLNRFAAAVTNYSLSGSDANCQTIAGSAGSTLKNNAEAAVTADLRQKLQAATLGKAVCPLQ